mmetsp:Transcript_8529/g.20627  ORF Transcript_8529/g.20627 Transcript_8529/m.20627 type:complete len:120 (+) Transcript_8529:607-966(+)|eukprot:g4875.t1
MGASLRRRFSGLLDKFVSGLLKPVRAAHENVVKSAAEVVYSGAMSSATARPAVMSSLTQGTSASKRKSVFAAGTRSDVCKTVFFPIFPPDDGDEIVIRIVVIVESVLDHAPVNRVAVST